MFIYHHAIHSNQKLIALVSYSLSSSSIIKYAPLSNMLPIWLSYTSFISVSVGTVPDSMLTTSVTVRPPTDAQTITLCLVISILLKQSQAAVNISAGSTD